MKDFYFFRLLLLALVMTIVSCDKEDDTPATPDPVANFTHTVSETNPLSVTFTNTSTNATSYSWDFGDGSDASTQENPTHIYEEGGTYTVTLTASRDGLSDTESQQVTVTDPTDEEPGDEDIVLGENILEGGEMTSEEGWTVYDMGAPELTNVEFTEDGLVFSNSGPSFQTDVAVWQAVEVEAGQTYQIAANVSGSGTTNSWVQFMLGRDEPIDGETYWIDTFDSFDFLSLNSFEGDNSCGIEPFDGDIADLACGGEGVGENGMVYFDEGGTVYFVVKAGSWDGNLGDGGVTISDVSMRPVISEESARIK